MPVLRPWAMTTTTTAFCAFPALPHFLSLTLHREGTLPRKVQDRSTPSRRAVLCRLILSSYLIDYTQSSIPHASGE